MSIFTFEECYVPRMWGGNSLRSVYAKPTPDEPIGEAWLISDHPQHTSVVNRGPDAGATLHDLLERDATAILGARASLTVHGRFPLLLKLLDAQDKLSIQVHPDDAIAAQLNEDDVGKTEMWHVLNADSGATLYCGMPDTMTKDQVEACLKDGTLSDKLITIAAEAGMSVFVPAGTVHAIGEGCLLAEIQQNSDLTYRMDDWGRVDVDGSPRELHLEKSKVSVKYPNTHPGPMPNFEYPVEGATIRVLAACPYFAAEEIQLEGECTQLDRGHTFQIILAKTSKVILETSNDIVTLQPGEAALNSGDTTEFSLTGGGSALMYYVPNIDSNIIAPLQAAGYTFEALRTLIG
ncbi:class I mannose-6-phosphate isomerase [bacterium AH-315-P07]|nr:class I mannose-6-phosphate isomerase [bacterium AH-315-P07]